jgi:Ca-activated chloride channel family protein
MRLLPLLILLAAAPAGAQSVADYYHAAAQAYIDGENADAEQAAEAGLAIDPTDAKLQALLEKIRERNPDDSGGEQEQDDAENQEDGEGEQQEQAQNGEQDPEAESEGQDEQQQPEGEQQQPEEPSEQNEQQGDAGAEGEQEPQEPQGGGSQGTPFEVKPGEMSQADAERILRAIESDELELLRDVQRRRARPRFVEKDW